MLTIKYQAAFKKDYKRIVKRGYDMRLPEKVIELLANQKPLPEKNRDFRGLCGMPRVSHHPGLVADLRSGR